MTLGNGQGSFLHRYTRTKSNTLWTVFDHRGVPVAIKGLPGHMTLPVFSTENAAGEWVMEMELEQHIVSKPLRGRDLVDFLELARRGGYTSVALDPPKKKNVGFPAAPINYFLDQAKAKVVRW